MKTAEYVDVRDGDIPGIVIRDGCAYGECGGRLWPVNGLLRSPTGYIPVLDIPQMEDVLRREAVV